MVDGKLVDAGVRDRAPGHHHRASNFHALGEVTNTVRAAVNNGVVVRLGSGSSWTVTGTSYVTGLALAADASVKAPRGKSLTMTVDRAETAVEAGRTYSGAIVPTVR